MQILANVIWISGISHDGRGLNCIRNHMADVLDIYPHLDGPSPLSKTRVGRAKTNGQYDLIFETANLVEPDPFPKGYQ